MKAKKVRHPAAQATFTDNPAIAHLMEANERRAEELEAWFKRNELPRASYCAAPDQRPRNRLRERGRAEEPTAEELEQQRITVNYLRAQSPFRPRPNSPWRDYAAEAFNHQASRGLSGLRELALAGDAKALEAIADLAIGATDELNRHSRSAPESVQAIARRRFLWPFLRGPKPRFGDDHEKLMEDIQLGRETPFSEEAVERADPDNIIQRTAMILLCRIENRRSNTGFQFTPLAEWEIKAAKLEPFCHDTWYDWFNVAKEALCTEYDGHPETDPELRKVGRYRSNHYEEKSVKKRGTNRTREQNIRDGIREALRRPIRALANFSRRNP
jgi:hypothetical protein